MKLNKYYQLILKIKFIIFLDIALNTEIIVISATLSNNILQMIIKFMAKDTIKILVKRDELTLEGIKLFFIMVEKEINKFPKLCDIRLFNNNTRSNIL